MKTLVKITKELIHIKLTVLMFTILPIAVFTLIAFKLPIIANFRSFVVLTGSMSPLIPAGSIVYSQKQDSYAINDIITFEKNKSLVTHRIVGVKNENNSLAYITRGDANNVADGESVKLDSIVGKAQFHFPYVGKFLVNIKSVQGLVIYIFIPAAIFILMELWNIKKEIEKETEKKLTKRFNQMQDDMKHQLMQNQNSMTLQ